MLTTPKAQGSAISQVHIPAPVGGLNVASPASMIGATDSVAAVNVIANESGLRSRLGYSRWASGMGAGHTVRTVIGYTGSTAAQDKLWAITDEGIYDVSSTTYSPTLSYAWATQGGNAGYCSHAVVVTTGGHFLLVADEVNGLVMYTESTQTWAAVAYGTGGGEIDGINPANVRFVMSWKNRVWLVEADTGSAFYLDVGVIAGTATEFAFGNKFRTGGYLVGLWNWTVDGGTGIDDHLVAVSSSGDVLVYQGTNPASAVDFSLRGEWFVGAVPAGRDIATTIGGDLWLLTYVGILPLSKLLTGEAVNPNVYASRKVQPLFAAKMADRGSLRGWAIRMSPKDQALIITVPDAGGRYTEQFALSLSTGGWSQLSGYPMHSADVWGGDLYFGGPDGYVYKAEGGQDGERATDIGLFVAVGNAVSLYSSYGTTWSTGDLGGATFYATASNDQIMVAVGSSASYSYDGMTWTTAETQPTNTSYGVAWSGACFVAVGPAGSSVTICTSTDGRNWSPAVDAPTTGTFYGVCWTGQNFVAVGVSSGTAGICYTSPDGYVWTQRTIPTPGSYRAVACLDYSARGEGYSDVVFAVGASVAAKSLDGGLTWTSVATTNIPGTWHAIVGIENHFIFIGDSVASSRNLYGYTYPYTNPAGVFTQISGVSNLTMGTTAVAVWRGMAYDRANQRFVALTADASAIGSLRISSDGGIDNPIITWTATTPASGTIYGAAYTSSATPPRSIEISGCTGFNNLGSASRKQATLIAPHFVADGKAPDVAVAARYDFRTDAISEDVIEAPSRAGTWDNATWDVDKWGAGGAETYRSVRGARGVGTMVAIAYKAEVDVPTTLVGFDVTVRKAGVL